MTNKQYLRQGYLIKQKIIYQEDILKEFKSNLESLRGITYSKNKVQGGPVQDDSLIIKKIDKIIETEKILNNLHKELDLFQERIYKDLESIESYTEKTIILNRYINNLSWQEIADKIGYSTAQTYRLHGKALEKFKILTNDIE